MARVKGSREYSYRVVRRNPIKDYWIVGLALLILLLLIGVSGVGFYLGAQTNAAPEVIDPVSAGTKADSATKDFDAESRKQLETALLGAEVDRRALEGVRTEVAELKTQMAALQEENQFYRNLMSPAGSQRGLTFGAVEIVDTERPRAFRFKVVMQQLGTNQRQLTGTLSFNLVGRQAGQRVVLPLKDVSTDVDATNIKLKFKYFQNIEGDLVLPEGFEPERIELEARSSQPSVTKIEKRFGWLVQER